jgi:hypothetical protein
VGWLDGTGVAPFKKDAEGRDLFFPFGKLAAGRVVPSAADGAWIRSYLKIWLIGTIITAVPVILIGRVFRTSFDLAMGALFIGTFVVVLIVPWVVLWMCVRSWPRAGEREISVQDALSRSANEIGPIFLWIGTVCSGLMVAASLFLLLATDETMGAVLALAFFGMGLGFFVLLHRARRSN